MALFNRNLILASNLYRGSALLIAVGYFAFEPRPGWIFEFLVIALTLFIAYLVRSGSRWIRWVLLVITAIFIPLFVISMWGSWKGIVLLNLTALAIALLQTLAAVYLFLPLKDDDDEETDVKVD